MLLCVIECMPLCVGGVLFVLVCVIECVCVSELLCENECVCVCVCVIVCVRDCSVCEGFLCHCLCVVSLSVRVCVQCVFARTFP